MENILCESAQTNKQEKNNERKKEKSGEILIDKLNEVDCFKVIV